MLRVDVTGIDGHRNVRPNARREKRTHGGIDGDHERAALSRLDPRQSGVESRPCPDDEGRNVRKEVEERRGVALLRNRRQIPQCVEHIPSRQTCGARRRWLRTPATIRATAARASAVSFGNSRSARGVTSTGGVTASRPNNRHASVASGNFGPTSNAKRLLVSQPRQSRRESIARAIAGTGSTARTFVVPPRRSSASSKYPNPNPMTTSSGTGPHRSTSDSAAATGSAEE